MLPHPLKTEATPQNRAGSPVSAAIAIVGMACCYPDARNPQELWENVMAQRRAFRRLPAERLFLRDYLSADSAAPDSIYSSEAALIQGYEFDRVRFRVSGPIFRSVDLAHWVALDVADQALQDAGLSGGMGLPKETTGVLVGNTLTGEFSRAATLRLRWPYVRRVVEARLRAEEWEDHRRLGFLRELEKDFKAPFAPVGEETLAGALSNTIAGRICNYFHLGGGGYTVDGACCSSLLAVARACSALEAGEIDAALAGGVDISLDPFELVGFAKVGALARGEMRIYDRESSGFLPGEGSGFVVLMRAEDAQAQGLRVYATIRGWGVSSDGAGSITRPEPRGQMLALQRAYRRAGYGAETVGLFEGHGTGTPVGDQVELQTLTEARKASGAPVPPAALGSIKANFGHTKAAAGIAGLIKATLAVYHQTLPPTTGVRRPRPELEGEDAVLRVLENAERWPENRPLRAGINSFGFGGINVHVTIEGCSGERNAGFSPHEQVLRASAQDAELFLLDAGSSSQLAAKTALLAGEAAGFSYSDLADVSAALARRLNSGCWRAAVVARTPAELAERLDALRGLLESGTSRHLDLDRGLFVGAGSAPPRIGFLFPGQASPVRLSPGVHGRRFTETGELYEQVKLPKREVADSTHVAQLAIISAELAGLRLLKALGIAAVVGIGHSLGELAAYCWAGALDEAALLRLVDVRGRRMAELSGPAGAMANISASAAEVQELIGKGAPVVLACFNAPNQTVVAGEKDAVTRIVSRAQSSGWSAVLLSAAHAFHSPLMAPAARQFQEAVNVLELSPLHRQVVSTITGADLLPTADLRRLLVEQLTAPVRFAQAFACSCANVDLFLEVGPGRVLTHLVNGGGSAPVISLDMAGPSLAGVLQAAAAAYVLGAPVQTEALFGNRFTRFFDLDQKLRFFVNPCELVPPSTAVEHESNHVQPEQPEPPEIEPEGISSEEASPAGGAVEAIRALVARRTELPPAAIQESTRLLRDLHLNSIVVAEIVAATARELGMPPPGRPLDFADASIGELAQALERLRSTSNGSAPEVEGAPAGVGDWRHAFVMEWSPCAVRQRYSPPVPPGQWKVFAATGDARAEQLRATALPGTGLLVCLSASPVDEQAGMLLEGAQAALAMADAERYFIVIGPAASVAAAFARTLHLENPNILTRVIEAPLDANVSDFIRSELTDTGHVEVRYNAAGERFERCCRLLPRGEERAIPLDRNEVLLVSGGGKGIVAECVSALARETGAKLVILGRSRPENDAELAHHLEELAGSGVHAKYIPTDISDPRAVRSAVREAESAFGRVVGIVHGAGHNEPKLLRDLDEAALRRALAPKVEGLRNLIAAVDTEHLRLLVSFGSVIGRVGLRGEAHYALANSCLTSLTEELAGLYPACCCVALEFSAWSGLGMAERLGTVEALHRDGIATLTPDEGVSWFRHLLSRSLPSPAIVVSGRLGAFSPLPISAPPLPLLRFLERPRVHYPGIELVVDSDLTTGSDPYLLDHVFHGEPLLPGVMGLEAMSQVAMAMIGATKPPVLEDIRFEQPLVVEKGARVTLRAAALLRDAGLVEVVLRSSHTSFAIDHFRCFCRFTDRQTRTEDVITIPESRVEVEPDRDLYGNLLFQTGRFRRLAGYRSLSARTSWAEIAPAGPQSWFSQYLPGTLMLGDPGARDAAIHSIQACVPHALLLPVGVEHLAPGNLSAEEPLLAHARERWQEGNTYCYDVEVRGVGGELRESWLGLKLHKVANTEACAWPDALVAASLEWRVREMSATTGLAAAFERGQTTNRRSRSERAIQRVLGSQQKVCWRADGRPEVKAAISVSSAHMNGLTLAVAGPKLVACDLEPISARSDQVWRDLLGAERWRLAELIAIQAGEDLQTSATRVWTAVESLKKAGAPPDGPLVLLACPPEKPGCVSLGMDGLKIATAVVTFRDHPVPAAVSILTGSD